MFVQMSLGNPNHGLIFDDTQDDDSESEDEEEKARQEQLKAEFFDSTVTVANTSSFEQLQLSRPLLKVAIQIS